MSYSKCFKRHQTPWNQPTTVLEHGANVGGEMRGETLFQRNRLAKNLGLAWAVISVTLMMWLLD